MSGSKRGFTVIDEPAAAPPAPDQATQAGTQMLLLGLRALSQRAVSAISDLFTLFLVGSVMFVFWQIIDNPNQTQVVCASIYALFCFLVDAARRRNG